MIGTEKQIKWATEIKASFEKEVVATKNHLDANRNDSDTRQAQVDNALKSVVAQRENWTAKEWIDNRSLGLREAMRLMLVK